MNKKEQKKLQALCVTYIEAVQTRKDCVVLRRKYKLDLENLHTGVHKDNVGTIQSVSKQLSILNTHHLYLDKQVGRTGAKIMKLMEM